MVHPETADGVVLGGRGGAVDLAGAHQLRDLGGRGSHSARRRLDQHALARPERAVADQARGRRRVHDRQGGALLEAPAVGQGNEVPGAGHDQLGVGAEAAAAHHAISDRDPLGPLPQRLDLAGELVADDARRLRRVLVQAHPCEHVGEVHAGGLHPHPHLARAWLRIGPLLDLHYLGPAVLGDHQRPHRAGRYRLTVLPSKKPSLATIWSTTS